MVDDKTSIGIGPVDTPVEATRRQRQVLEISNIESGLMACDHDHIPQSITPSVTLRIDPIDAHINWYEGQVYVSYKCAIFRPSTALQHATEMKSKLEEGFVKPFLNLLSDGGPDHKTTNVSTHISLISLFRSLDLDGIIAARTPPYLSVLNPCERVMPTINYALYGLSLAQTRLNDSEHELVKNLITKSDWRKAQEKESSKPLNKRIDYAELAEKSLTDARKILTERTKELVFGSKNVIVVDPTPKDHLDELMNCVKDMFTTYNFQQKTTKNDFQKNDEVREFYEKHVHELTYVLQIKKCNDLSCKYHLPIRSTDEQMKNFV